MTAAPESPDGWLDSRERACALAAVVVGTGFLLLYLAIVAQRIGYPFELEWMEGGTVLHLQRILDGLPLYARPTPEFIAFGYSPLYFYVSAGVAALVGNGFFAPRLVSFLASLACFAFIYLVTRRRSDSRSAAYLAVCLFAAAFHATGAWLDLARVDTLFLALLLAAIWAFESPAPALRSLLSPALFFLAFASKQTALTLAFPLCAVAFLLRRGGERYLFGALLVVLVFGSTWLFDRMTDGWYSYYVFELPRDHGIGLTPQIVFGIFWIRDLLPHVAVALCLCLVPFLELVSQRAWNARLLLDATVFGGLVVMSWIGRIQEGGWFNALLPAYAGIAIYFGVGVARAFALLPAGSAFRIGVSLAVLLQFAALTYLPGEQIPTAVDRRETQALIERVAATQGDVYLGDHPWYKVLAGKPPQAHAQAVIDILRAHNPERRDEILRELTEALASGRYELLICDIEGCSNGVTSWGDWYELAPEKPTPVELILVAGGPNHKPTFLYRRRGAH